MTKAMKSKEKLIDAMAQLLLYKGLANTSPQDILNEAKLGKGSLYHHFDGKIDLAFHAIKSNADRFIEESQKAIVEKNTASEKLIALIKKPRNIARGCRIGQMAKDTELMSNPDLAREVNRSFEWTKSTIEQLVRQGIEEGSLTDKLAPLEATSLIIATLQGGYVIAKGLIDDTYFTISTEALLKVLIKSPEDKERT